MATIKSYTDIEQSKKLAEILPLESADMYWWSTSLRYYIEAMDDGDFNEEGDVRAWSLAALLSVLPRETRLLKSATDDIFYHIDCPKGNVDEWFDNPVDACYELILKLNELKML